MKHLLAVPALVFAANAMAQCPASMPESTPVVPNGQEASHEEMYHAQVAVKDYVDAIETYLDCRSELHPLQHSRSVYLAETMADSYNAELAKFRARENMLATN
ncbi:hypothetical protein [Parahaliea mediterranea]|uniref:DUF4398 domain-containing protein n=1 Tax=Parahaliea mediterranea TaxID=651086 RepID=A0A939IIW9_9GAMM|nr:hypothetical protein [Parahaliea mediterranea]MBN7795676.1 hypothetical protein [Parahaliea mediterranea]